MRSGILLVLPMIGSAGAGELQAGLSLPFVGGGDFMDFLFRGAAEPGMMVALAAATIGLQFVRKYRASESSRGQMVKPTLQGGAPANTEG